MFFHINTAGINYNIFEYHSNADQTEEFTTEIFTTEIFEMETPKQQYPEVLSHLVCDESRPNQEFPGDCALFLQCAPGMGPVEHPNLVEKTCGPHMLYHPHTMTCDWPQTVIATKPECGGT